MNAFVSLGSNVGARAAILSSAVRALRALPGVSLKDTSHLYETAPMHVTAQPHFLNAVVRLQLHPSSPFYQQPLRLLGALKQIEEKHGRKRDGGVRFGPRLLDLDILLIDKTIHNSPELVIPHPRLHERNFVLQPLSDIAPLHSHFHLTISQSLHQMLHAVPKNDVRRVSIAQTDHSSSRSSRSNRMMLMGIINANTDSFSGDGIGSSAAAIAARARQLHADGADIIDIGAQSTRPSYKLMDAAVETHIIVSAIEAIKQQQQQHGHFEDVWISVDTFRAAVAAAALQAGATMINNVYVGTEAEQLNSHVAAHDAKLVVMHNSAVESHVTSHGGSTLSYNPSRSNATGDDSADVVARVAHDLNLKVSEAIEKAGICRWNIVVDPGIGFGKSVDENMALLRGVDTLSTHCGGMEVLVGPSRKSFIALALSSSSSSSPAAASSVISPAERVSGTIGACLAASLSRQTRILRVHDVKSVREALHIFQSVLSSPTSSSHLSGS